MPYPNSDVVSPGEFVLHYKVEQRLGAGGMGIVYKALDTKLKRYVALKFLPGDLGSDPSYRERLLREALAASAIDHPNMGAVYAIEEVDCGNPFIVMAYYEGETLRDRLRRGPLPTVQVIDIAIQVARGLAKAHELGIIHRDIKPSNLILTREGVVKIVDFGLARISGADNLTKTGTTVGTAAYMSPEQAMHSAMDHRADIWSLGVVIHEMLRGDVPFHGDSAISMLYAVVHHAPEPLTDAPPALAAIVSRCLKKDPQERYGAARELIDEMERVRAGIFVPAVTETVVMPESRRSVRRTPIAIAAAAVLLVAAGVLWRELSRSPDPAQTKPEMSAPAVVSPAPAHQAEPAPKPPAATKPKQVAPRAEPAASRKGPGATLESASIVAKLPPVRRALSAAEYGGPLHGELQWSGTLATKGTLTIQAGQVASGSLTDDLPLAPITVEVAPAGVGVVEAPSARNQWDRLVLRNESGGVVSNITVRWKIVR